MEIKISFKLFLVLILLILATTIASAEVLVMNLNSVEYSAGEAGKVFGYVLDNSYSAESGVNVSIYLGGSFESIETTDLNGYYEYYVTNLTQGTYNISTNTSLNEQILTFEVYPAKPKYQIIALSLVVPYINPVLDFTVNKYLGQTLTNNSYSYSIYYPNGTTYASSGVGVSGTEELNVSLPQEVGLYTIVVDEKKSFTVAVSKFTLKFKVTDSAGNQQDVFKPNGIAYFQVEGFSNGQKISNATVTAKTIDPTGGINTVTFIETNGIYKGNTNVTQSGTAIQLRGGDYEVEFTMKDSSNNEQKVKGYFKVLGLSVDVNLVDKKPYRSGEDAEFDVIVKNLADGTLVEHADIVYFFELEKDGQFYDISALNASEASDSTITSTIDLTIPVGMEDGGYFLNIRVESSSNTGSGNEYLEVSNTDLFLQLTDNFDDYREFFKPGERAKAKVQSNVDLVNMTLEVFTKQGHVPTLSSTEDLTGSAGSLTFTVPTETGQYRAKVTAYSDSGAQVVRQKWFSVQNYHSFLDVRNLDNNPQFILTSGESFFGVINVFDITTNSPADLSDFRIKFDKIVNEETGKEYKNMRTTKNVSLSSETTGQVAYKIVPPSLPNGFYKIQYTLVDDEGESFYGEGWFGISAFDVEIETYDSNGRQKKQFSSGESINITVSLSSGDNGTATLHREFYDEASFSIINGEGSVLLSSTSTDDALKIPSQAGFYPFGIEVENQDDETGLGDNFFEIRNLNFRSVSVRNNGKYATGADILADVVVEKQGDLVEDVNVSLARVVRSNDWFDVSDQIIDTGAALTSALGATTITLQQFTDLNDGTEANAADDNVAVKPAAETAGVDMKVLMDDDAIKGDPNAPVTIVEWSDFECPFCVRFYEQTYNQIVTEYIDTGKAKLVYRDFPLSFHANAQKAAEAAECAGEQGKYYDMHDLLFESGVSGGVNAFKKYAADLGLDTVDFAECLDSGSMAAEVAKDMVDGGAAGVRGTPGFVIDGEVISGAQPFSVFKTAIDKALAK